MKKVGDEAHEKRDSRQNRQFFMVEYGLLTYYHLLFFFFFTIV